MTHTCKRARFSVFCLFILLFCHAVFAQEVSESEASKSESELYLKLNASIFEADGKTLKWNKLAENPIKNGKPVAIKFTASNALVQLTLTCYAAPDGTFALSIENQLWITEANGVVRYSASLRTIPFTLGEALVIYPLGKAQGATIMQIEVIVVKQNAN